MIFCQFGRAGSWREICNGLGRCLGKLTYLGIAKLPQKSAICAD